MLGHRHAAEPAGHLQPVIENTAFFHRRAATAYSISKAAVLALVRNAALELGALKIRSNAALFLASDLSEWITGTALPVDGGALAATYVQTGPITAAVAKDFVP